MGLVKGMLSYTGIWTMLWFIHTEQRWNINSRELLLCFHLCLLPVLHYTLQIRWTMETNSVLLHWRAKRCKCMEGVLTVILQHEMHVTWSRFILSQCSSGRMQDIWMDGDGFLSVEVLDVAHIPKTTASTHAHKRACAFSSTDFSLTSNSHSQAAGSIKCKKKQHVGKWVEFRRWINSKRSRLAEANLSFSWNTSAHTSMVEQQGHIRGKTPMSPSLIGVYPSALSPSH